MSAGDAFKQTFGWAFHFSKIHAESKGPPPPLSPLLPPIVFNDPLILGLMLFPAGFTVGIGGVPLLGGSSQSVCG